MFDKQQRKFKRSMKLIAVLSKFGFQDMLSRIGLKGTLSKSANVHQLSTPERVRLALQELGPLFVKLGQTFSNREDLLPMEYIVELQKLQDQVDVIDLDIRLILEEELQIDVDAHFSSIDEQPFAAASIAQVYKATLLTGQPVIIKVRRPGIDQIIKDDLLLLKDLVKLIDTYSELDQQIGLRNAVLAFERSLLEELSMNKERQNILQFQRNFQGNPDCYVPSVYEELCSDNVLTMEFISGIKITDLEALRNAGLDPKTLSEAGYRLYVTQLLDHGFFHADPHAGNLMVNEQGQLVFIDFGAMGKIPTSEKPAIEGMIMGLMAKKSDKIIRQLKKLAVHYHIPNERKFQMDVEEILEIVHTSSLQEINIPEILLKMKEVLRENRLIMPDYFFLLFKGISLIDGVGRQLNPDLDVVESLKPLLKKMMRDKLHPDNIAKIGMDKLTDFMEAADELPNEVRTVISRLVENKLTVNTNIRNFDRMDYLIQSGVTNLILALILAANIIATAIILASGTGPHWGNIPVLVVLASCFSALLVVLLFVRLLRR